MLNPIYNDDAEMLARHAAKVKAFFSPDRHVYEMTQRLRHTPRLLFALLSVEVISAAVAEYLTSSGGSRGCDHSKRSNQAGGVASTNPAPAGDAGDQTDDNNQNVGVPSINSSAQADATDQDYRSNQSGLTRRDPTPAQPAGDAHIDFSDQGSVGIPTTNPSGDGQGRDSNQSSLTVAAADPTHLTGQSVNRKQDDSARQVRPPRPPQKPAVFGRAVLAAAVSYHLDREVVVRISGDGRTERLRLAECSYHHIEQAASTATSDSFYFSLIANAMDIKNAKGMAVGAAFTEDELTALAKEARRKWNMYRTKQGLDRSIIDLKSPEDFREAV